MSDLVPNRKTSESIDPDLRRRWHDMWTVSQDTVQNQGLVDIVPWGMFKESGINGYWVMYVAWSQQKGLLHQYVKFDDYNQAPQPHQKQWKSSIPVLPLECSWTYVRCHIDDLKKKYHLGNQQAKLNAEARDKFINGLEDEQKKALNVMSVLSNSHPPQIAKMLAYILGSNPTNYHSRQECSQRRSQFINTYPLLAYDIILREKFFWIDGGKQAIPYLSKHFKCSEKLIKFSQQLNTNPANYRHTAGVFKSQIPQWNVISNCMSLKQLSEFKDIYVNQSLHIVIDTFFNTSCVKKEPEILRALNLDSSNGCESLRRMKAGTILHMNDMCAAFAREILLPYFRKELSLPDVNHELKYQATSLILHTGINRVYSALKMHLGDQVHSAIFGRSAQLEDKWPSPGSSIKAPNGMVLRFLTSQVELDWEGEVQDICVASYGMDCKRGFCTILSIGNWLQNSWIPNSTVELRLNSFDKLEVQQHQGKENSEPETSSVVALEWWQDQLESGNIKLNTDHLITEDYQEDSTINLEYALGEQWDTEEGFSYRWDRWRRLLNTSAKDFPSWLEVIEQKWCGSKESLNSLHKLHQMSEKVSLEWKNHLTSNF